MANAPDLTRMLDEAASLRAVARRLARDDSEAADFVQDAYARAIEHPPRPDSAWRRWLATVLRNQVRSVRRSERRAEDHARLELRESVESRTPAEIAGDAEERVKLQRALAQALLELDAADRTLVVQAWIDGVPGPVLAARLGLSHDALRQRLSRARSRLRARLDREYGSRAAWSVLALGDRAVPVHPILPIGVASVTTLHKIALAAALLAALVAVAAWTVSGDRAGPDARTSANGPTLELAGANDPAIGAPADAGVRALVLAAVTPPDSPAPPRVFDRERDLHGVVVDPLGVPVPGVHVRAGRRTNAGFLGFDIEEDRRPQVAGEDVSDSRGEFAIPLERGLPYSLLADAPGFAPVHIARLNAGERVTVRLVPAGSLAVEVVDPDGRPRPDLRVRISKSPPNDRDDAWWPIAEATVDVFGRALLTPLPPGEVTIEVTPAGGGWPDWSDAQIVAGAVTEKRITLAARQRVEGVVVERDGGRPIAGARVGCAPWFGDTTTTGGDGRFTIDAYPLEYSLIHAWADGFGHATGQVERGEDDRVLGSVRIELDRGFAITGTVTDEDGSPVANAYVGTSGRRHEGRFFTSDDSSTHSDALGSFRLAGVRPGFGRVLTVRSDGRAARVLRIEDPPSDVLDVGRVALGAAARVTGIVRDEGGHALAARGVVLLCVDAESGPGDRAIDPLVQPFVAQRTARTDDLGRFAFGDLPGGEYTVSPLNDEEYLAASHERLQLGAGQRLDGIVLAMRSALAIRGRAYLPDGSPAAQVGITACRTSPPLAISTAATDSEGRFELLGVAPGANELVVACNRQHSQHGPLLVRVEAGGQDVELRLPPPAKLAGRVLRADGGPTADLVVAAHEATTGVYLESVGTDGEGRFELVVADGMRITVSCEVPGTGGGPALAARMDATIGDAVDLALRAGR